MADPKGQAMTDAEREQVTDKIDPARAGAWMATLGLEGSASVGSELPPFSHHAFFWSPKPESALGHDGHAALGGFLPDLGLPVRMYAGGALRQHAPFRSGVQAERDSRVASVTRKEGRTGALAFVTIRHEIRQRSQPVLSEDQTLVYRQEASPSEARSVTMEADERRALKLSAVTLFRYSALTFNAHRIHYDADYARELGYPGLVVHGPLLATSLALWAQERAGHLSSFSFRAEAPLFLGDVAWLCRAGSTYWVEGPKRRLCMSAEVAD